jgi:hypothetical protein
MKIRNGFVSNSSTSSFVIIGFDIQNNEFAKKSLLEFAGNVERNCPWDISESLRKKLKIKTAVFYDGKWFDGLNKKEKMLGILLVEVSSDGGDVNETFCMEDIQKDLDVLKNRFEITEPLKIRAGTMSS